MKAAVLRRWLPLLVALGLLLPATGWLFVKQLEQTVDSSNTALKDPDSADARNLRALAAVVPSQNVILLAYRVEGGLPILPVDRAAIATARDVLLALPAVASCDELPAPERSLAMLAAAVDGPDVGRAAEAVVAEARRLCPPALRFLATGLPLYESRVADHVAAERRTIVPLIGLCLLGASWLVYRRLGLALAALLPAFVAIIWTSGIVAALGHPLDPVSALLDPVLLTIGVASSVHFVEAWRRGLAGGRPAREAGAFASRDQRAPLLLATATTMVGMLSMTTSHVPAVVDFGIRAALGIAIVHAAVFLLLPRWLALQSVRRTAPAATGDMAARWGAALIRRRTWITAGTVAVTSLALAGLPALTADNNPLTMLPVAEPSRVAHDELAAQIGGVETFHVLVPADSAGTDPARLLPFLAAAQTMPGIAGPAGPLLRGDGGELAAPLLLEPGGSAARVRLFDELGRAATVLGLDGALPAGAAVQMARDSQGLVRGLLTSTVLAIVLLGLGMCLGLRSFRLGLIGVVPMILACSWIYGAIAWLEHPVSVATGMIGCTMLGLIVDNALHLLHHHRILRRELAPRRAILLTLQLVGRPIWLSSVLLVVGFGAAATSELVTTREFSLLACTTIAVALFGCLVLLPLMLSGGAEQPEAVDAV